MKTLWLYLHNRHLLKVFSYHRALLRSLAESRLSLLSLNIIMLKSLGMRKKASSATLRADDPIDSKPLEPTQHTGLLTIRVMWAEGLSVPGSAHFPPAVQAALASSQARAAAAVSPSSVTQQRMLKRKGNRDSVQRAQCWWLPYMVMEFDVNQVLITSLGGDIDKPVYMYQAHLSVYHFLVLVHS